MPEDVVVAPVVPVEPAASATPATQADVQNTGDEATPAAPEGEKPEAAPTPEQEAKRKQNRLDRKLDKAFRQRAEAQAKADFLEKQLAEERAKNSPVQNDGKPTLAQFDYDPEKYADAVAKYATDKAATEAKAKHQEETGKQFQQKLVSDWDEKVARAEDKYDDWQKKVGDLTPNSPFTAAIMEAENGEDIAYYLGTHPEEARRIVSLHPLSQAREIGKLEAKLLSEPQKPQLPSSAPVPIKPVGGSSSPATKRLMDMSQDEFDKKRKAQIAARR